MVATTSHGLGPGLACRRLVAPPGSPRHVWHGDRRLTPGGGLRYRAPPGIFSDAQAFGHHFWGGRLYGGPRKPPGYGGLSKGPPRRKRLAPE